MAVSDDFVIDTDNRIIRHVTGTTVYTVNALYSYMQDYFEEIANMSHPVPMSAQTPTEYTLANGWFVPVDTFKYLNGGAIKTEGWDAASFSNGVLIIKFSSGGYTPAVPTDIGLPVSDGIRTGILLDYNNTLRKWWIRKTSTVQLVGAMSVAGGAGAGTSSSVVTGETLYSNIYTLGLLEPSSTNVIYVEQINTELTNNQIVQYWPAEHVDLLIKTKEANTLIDSGILKIYCREYGNLYSHFITNVAAGGRNPIPLGTATDSNNITPSANVAAWSDVTITPGTFSIDTGNGSGTRTYYLEVDCGNRTTVQQVYERLKLVNSRASGFTVGTTLGQFYRAADPLYVESVTSPIGTFAGGKFFAARGVYLKNVPANDLINVTFIDSTGIAQGYPYIAAGTITVSDALKNDQNAVYRMFYTTNPSGNYGTIAAVAVQNASGNAIVGNVGGVTSIPWTFSYDLNSQGGRTPGTDAVVTVIGSGLDGGQYVVTTSTITRATGQNISLLAGEEKNYT